MSTTRPSHIVVVGSLNMDMVMKAPRAPVAGETLSGCEFALANGGKGANQAVACARLGARTSMIGRVGADDFGTRLRSDLSSDGIDVTNIFVDTSARTGVAVIVVDASAENRIMIASGANATLTPEHIDDAGALVDSAAIMLVQLEVPMLTVLKAIQRATAAGVPVLLNPAPAHAVTDVLWSQVEYLVPNEVEASHLSGIQVSNRDSAAKAARHLVRQGARHVLITLGAQGVLICDADGVRIHEPPSVRAVDTTAAGDTFIGALAAGLTNGSNLDDAAKFAVTAAALSVTRAGAQPSIPYRAEVLQLQKKRIEEA